MIDQNDPRHPPKPSPLWKARLFVEGKINDITQESALEIAKAYIEQENENAYLNGLLNRLRVLLNGVAAAFFGPPPANVLHDWSSLPRIAEEIRALGVIVEGEHPNTHPAIRRPRMLFLAEVPGAVSVEMQVNNAGEPKLLARCDCGALLPHAKACKFTTDPEAT